MSSAKSSTLPMLSSFTQAEVDALAATLKCDDEKLSDSDEVVVPSAPPPSPTTPPRRLRGLSAVLLYAPRKQRLTSAQATWLRIQEMTQEHQDHYALPNLYESSQ